MKSMLYGPPAACVAPGLAAAAAAPAVPLPNRPAPEDAVRAPAAMVFRAARRPESISNSLGSAIAVAPCSLCGCQTARRGRVRRASPGAGGQPPRPKMMICAAVTAQSGGCVYGHGGYAGAAGECQNGLVPTRAGNERE